MTSCKTDAAFLVLLYVIFLRILSLTPVPSKYDAVIYTEPLSVPIESNEDIPILAVFPSTTVIEVAVTPSELEPMILHLFVVTIGFSVT